MTQSKKQALSFDEWWEENYMNVSADRTEAEDIYNLGAESRQEEVSELQAEVDELQKRINVCLDYVGTDFNDFYTGVLTESIHEILKGEIK